MKLIAQSNRQKLAPSTSQSQSIKFEEFILGGRKRSLFNQRQHCILSAWVIPPRGANRATILESFKLNPLFFALHSASAAAPNNILVLRRCRRLTRWHDGGMYTLCESDFRMTLDLTTRKRPLLAGILGGLSVRKADGCLMRILWTLSLPLTGVYGRFVVFWVKIREKLVGICEFWMTWRLQSNKGVIFIADSNFGNI